MARLHGFQKRDLLNIFEYMMLARRMDEKMLMMLRQGKSFFLTAGSGHEAAQLAAAANLQPGKDWSYLYYRELAFYLKMGGRAKDVFLSFLARKDDPDSGGRQFPYHFSRKDLRIVSPSSATGMQFLQAVGTALGVKWEKLKEVVYVSSGEGATSQGDFHEALNWASREKLPVIFHIQDNDYAISVPKAQQTAGGSIYDMVGGYKNLARYNTDGTNYFETNLAFKNAVDRARKGKGPSVIISHVVRLLPHSSSDDHRKYLPEKDLEELPKRDPIPIFKNECLKAGIISEKEFSKIKQVVFARIDRDADWAELQEHPSSDTALDHLYSGAADLKETKLKTGHDKVVLVDQINHALHEEMERNEKMVIYGQDVSDFKGGVFTATKGLSTKYGDLRVFNAPLAESSIIGTALGLAVRGYKPVVEIQFGDYIWTAMMQIKNEVAMLRYRSNNSWSCPMVIRVPVGGYIHGGPYHSQSIESYFYSLPGIRMAYPSNAGDAKALLKAACRMDDPVLFFEHKGLYRQGFAAALEPDDNYILPFGKARIVTEGNILTLITWGAMVQKSQEAVKACDLDEGMVEIIDLRTLNPLDLETILKSVQKTGKALVVYEANKTGGPGGEIAALVSENCFEYLDGPVKRVAAKDCHIPYNLHLEREILPQIENITKVLTALLEY
ncbi:MAG: thiamine pyrophosphate-dependent enzyme [Candidatus Neomarinimicrobiota bacterium]